MKRYRMYVKDSNRRDLIHLIQRRNKEEAVQYFAEIKRLPIQEFKKIFIVKEVKDERVLHKRTN